MTVDPRVSRRAPEELDEFQMAERHPDFRVDLERIRFSPYFSRLSAVTQVISQSGAGLAVHNRLTWKVAVAAPSVEIAIRRKSAAPPALPSIVEFQSTLENTL